MATASSKSSSVRIIQEGRKLLEERLDPKIVGQLVLHGLIDEQAFATVDKAGENGGLTEKRECLTEILLAALDSEDKAKSFKKVLKDTQEDLYRDLFPDPESKAKREKSTARKTIFRRFYSSEHLRIELRNHQSRRDRHRHVNKRCAGDSES